MLPPYRFNQKPAEARTKTNEEGAELRAAHCVSGCSGSAYSSISGRYNLTGLAVEAIRQRVSRRRRVHPSHAAEVDRLVLSYPHIFRGHRKMVLTAEGTRKASKGLPLTGASDIQEHFDLTVCTRWQALELAAYLQRVGDKHAIMVDGCFNTNAQDYCLINAVIVSHGGKGVLIGSHLSSSNEGAESMRRFADDLFAACGVRCVNFMCDKSTVRRD